MNIDKDKLLQNLLEALEKMPDAEDAKEEMSEEMPKDAKGLEVVKIKALGKDDGEEEGEMPEMEMAEDDEDCEKPLMKASDVMKKKMMG
jgi:hypothetical protein